MRGGGLEPQAPRAPQLLTGIETFGFLRQCQRARDPEGRVIATLDDYAEAKRLLDPIFDAVVAGQAATWSRQQPGGRALPTPEKLNDACWARVLKEAPEYPPHEAGGGGGPPLPPAHRGIRPAGPRTLAEARRVGPDDAHVRR
jgi:hypothetical protein